MRRHSLFIVAAVAVLAAGCGGGSTTQTTSSGAASSTQQFDSVTLASVNNMLHLPEFVAQQEGFFAENGLNVKFQMLSGGAAINQAMQSGTAQFGGVSDTSVATARAAGLLIRLVAPGMNDATTATYAGPLAVIGRADRGIKANDPSSLIGKRVGAQSGSTNLEYLHLLLAKNNIPLNKVTIVPITSDQQPVSLRQGDIDAAANWEPYVSEMVSELGSNAAVVSRGEPLMGYTVGVSSPETVIAAQQTVLDKFAASLAEASHWIRANKAAAAAVAPNFITGLKPQYALDAMDHLSFDPRISGCTEQAFTTESKSLAASGAIKSSGPGSEMIDPSIISAVQQQHPEWFSDLPAIPASCGG